MKPFFEVYQRGGALSSMVLTVALAAVVGLLILVFQQGRGRSIGLFWFLVIPAASWIASGLVAMLVIGTVYGGSSSADPESNAKFLSRLLGDGQGIRAVGATLAGLVWYFAAFVLAIAALRIRAPKRRRIGALIALALLPAIAVTVLTVFGAPRIYFAFAGMLLIGALPLAIAAASCGEDRRSGALAAGVLMALISSFAALLLGQMAQIEARALASLPTAARDARPQLVLAMLLEMESLEQALIRVLPMLMLPVVALVWWARRRSSLLPGTMIMSSTAVIVPLLLHVLVSAAMHQARPSDLGVELVSVPRPGPVRIDHLLTDHSVETRGKDLHVALAADVSPGTLRTFLQHAGSPIVLVGDAAGWMERISIEEIASRDPSAAAFARAYGAINARVSLDPIGTSSAGHVLLKDQTAQELIDALVATPDAVIHLR